MPERIQRKRTRGWRMPAGAVYVGRPSRWGNPFRVCRVGRFWTVVDDNGVDYREPPDGWAEKSTAICKSVSLFAMDVQLGLAPYPLDELRGRDLACWCPPGPCHADVLLELANAEEVGQTDIDAVAEAIGAADTGPMDGLYRRMAQAAIDALQLAHEWAYVGNPYDEGDDLDEWSCGHTIITATRYEQVHTGYDRPVSRLVSPWVRAEEAGQ